MATVVRKGPVLKKKRVWKIESPRVLGILYSPTLIFSEKPSLGYRKDLKSIAAYNDLTLGDSLLDTVFNPIDQQLRELYYQIKNSA